MAHNSRLYPFDQRSPQAPAVFDTVCQHDISAVGAFFNTKATEACPPGRGTEMRRDL